MTGVRRTCLAAAAAVCATVLVLVLTDRQRAAQSPPLPVVPSSFEIVTAPLANTDAVLTSLQHQIRTQPERIELLERLGWALVERARERRDAGLYRLVLAAADALTEAGGGVSAADLLRGHALHALHRFAEAEVVARRLVAARGLAFDHGLLGDALLDRGRIEAAAAAYQRMMDLRPEASAYARAGRVRFLTGDLDGAIDAFDMAARAVSPRTPERFAWIWSEFSRMLLLGGRQGLARATAEQAAAVQPTSPVTLAARARVALAEDRIADAVAWLEEASRHEPSPDLLWPLAEGLRVLGRDAEANAAEARLLAHGAARDARGLALWLAHTRRDVPGALALAQRELEARQDPHTLDTLAWARFAAGDLAGAHRDIERALATGAPEPRFHLHAAAVAHARGDTATTALHVARASRGRHMLLPSERELLTTLAGPGVFDGRPVANTSATGNAESRIGTGEPS